MPVSNKPGSAPKEFFLEAYKGEQPPWDIDRPQPDIVGALDELGPEGGRAVDLGCGTGEHVLELARRGVEAWGIDSTPDAIELARGKALERGLTARFVLGDALDLGRSGPFDLVLDCGLYHVVPDEVRRAYVDAVRDALSRYGLHLMLGCQANDRDKGPRGYDPAELAVHFADGFGLLWARPATYETRDGEGRPAWLTLLQRDA